MVAAITGDAALMKALRTLKESAAKRAMQRGLNKGAQEGRKVVKASVPSRYKDIRKAIGWRAIKRSKNKNEPGAKIGAAVGKRGKSTKVSAKIRTGRKGVGIARNNIHWWFLGTKRRTTKAGKRTGRMPSQNDAVSVVLTKNGGRISQIIKTYTWQGFQKEVAKIKR